LTDSQNTFFTLYAKWLKHCTDAPRAALNLAGVQGPRVRFSILTGSVHLSDLLEAKLLTDNGEGLRILAARQAVVSLTQQNSLCSFCWRLWARAV